MTYEEYKVLSLKLSEVEKSITESMDKFRSEVVNLIKKDGKQSDTKRASYRTYGTT